MAGLEPRAPPADTRIVTTTRSHSTGLVQSALKALQPDQVLAVGGAGHKVRRGQKWAQIIHMIWLDTRKEGLDMSCEVMVDGGGAPPITNGE